MAIKKKAKKKTAAKSVKRAPAKRKKVSPGSDEISLTALFSKKPVYTDFSIWLIGLTPLISHAWSEKARREMLEKHVKATSPGRAVRDPQEEFLSSLYEMPGGGFGIPAMSLKKAILSVAHKDKGIPKTTVRTALYIAADIVSTRPALAGCVCDMPLLRIYGPEPQMREDMVRIGGINKTSNLAYRAQFSNWAVKLRGKFNPEVLTGEALALLIHEAGIAIGIGDWRNERDGVFGAFRMAEKAEEAKWEAFAAGKGKLPVAREAVAAE